MVKADVKHSEQQLILANTIMAIVLLTLGLSKQIIMPTSNYLPPHLLRMSGKHTGSLPCNTILIAMRAEKRSVYPSSKRYSQR